MIETFETIFKNINKDLLNENDKKIYLLYIRIYNFFYYIGL